MYESVCTALGTVVSAVKSMPGRNGPVSMFRFAIDHRRYDRASQGYRTSHTSYLTVTCYRNLAKNVESSLQVGERIIVYGSLKVSELKTEDGVRKSLKIEATSIGHDLLHGTAMFARTPRSEQAMEPDNDQVERQLRTQLESEDLISQADAAPLGAVGDSLDPGSSDPPDIASRGNGQSALL